MSGVTMATVALILFLQLLVYTTCQSPINQCSDKSPLPIAYNYQNCTDFVCCIVSETYEHFTVTFKSDHDVSSLQLQLKAVVSNDIYTVSNFPPPEENACDGLVDGKCPLKAGEIATHSSIYKVTTFKDTVVGMVEARMVDDQNCTLSCLIHSIKVVPPGQSCE